MFALQVRCRSRSRTRTGSTGWDTFYRKQNSAQRGLGGLGNPPTVMRDAFSSARRWSHQLWHLPRRLGQDSVSGLAREGRPEYHLLLRQWDLGRKWKQWFQISSDAAGTIRRTGTSLPESSSVSSGFQGRFGTEGKISVETWGGFSKSWINEKRLCVGKGARPCRITSLWKRFAGWMFVLTDFCDCAWREETTTRFSTTREQSDSLSPARTTRPGAVGSSFSTLRLANADAQSGSQPLPSCWPTSPSDFLLVGPCCYYNRSKVAFELLKVPLLINLLFIF